MGKSKKIIGIDLGTGFSCVSVMENGQPKVIFNSEGKATTPSVVSFAKDEIKVGQAALRQQVMYPKDTVSFIKRFMGEKYDDVLDEINRVQYNVVKGNNGLPCVDINGKLYTPQEISAMILQKMKKTAEDYLGEEVTDAVITCPAYYGDDARTAVKNAGEIAGLNVRRIINEPTAAALSYGYNIDSDKEKVIVVADIGCGTSDFTALEIGSGVVEVKSTNGDLHLGGVDFDNIIIDWIIEEFKKDNDGFDLSKDNMAMQRLAESAEKAKIELSSTLTTEINLPYITAVNGMPVHFIKTLTRANFEKMTDSLVKKIVDVCTECVKKAKMDFSEIDDVILVGGSTRIPSIQNAIEKLFGKAPNKSSNPDEAISLGACIQGGILSGDSNAGDILLLDVTPLNLGINTLGDMMTVLIPANTTIPTKKSEVFTNAADNQPSVQIEVLQGNRPMSADNKRLGVFSLDIIPCPKGMAKIEVSFDIDANGILNVSAKDLGTGKEQKIRIESNSGLSDADIQRMKDEAQANEAEDKKQAERVMTLNAADNAIFNCDKQLNELGDKMTEEQKSEIENAKNALKDAFERKSVEDCKVSMENLQNIWMKVGEHIYSQANTNGGEQQDFGQYMNDFMNGQQNV
jgi:molecular chaperone DnaK